MQNFDELLAGLRDHISEEVNTHGTMPPALILIGGVQPGPITIGATPPVIRGLLKHALATFQPDAYYLILPGRMAFDESAKRVLLGQDIASLPLDDAVPALILVQQERNGPARVLVGRIHVTPEGKRLHWIRDYSNGAGEVLDGALLVPTW